MRRSFVPVSGAIALALGALVLLLPEGLGAQTGSGSIFDRDFMFGKPRATLSLNMGYGVARAGSDIFQEMDTLLTLGRSDFDSPVVGGSLAFYLNDRFDLSFQVGFSRSETWSEYIDWVEDLGDGREAPIEQKTRFTRVPMTASVLYYPFDRGRQLSRFAWVPTTWSPYVGLGGGRVYYSFQHRGDFLDFEDFSIFTGDFRSSGYAWTGHALAGAQFALSAQIILSAEGRYSWADAELDRANFRDFQPIDLSGFQLTAGIGVRF
jgi:opacity protein-like surface antigen